MSERTEDTETIYNGIVTRPHQSNPKPFYTVTTVLISPYTVIKHILFRLLLSMNIHSRPYIHYLTLNDQNRSYLLEVRHVCHSPGDSETLNLLKMIENSHIENSHTKEFQDKICLLFQVHSGISSSHLEADFKVR